MAKFSLNFFVLLVGVLAFNSAGAQQFLTVEISGINSSKGKILLALFNSAAGFPDDSKKALMLKKMDAVQGKASIKFEGLLPGTYAVAVFHDKNSDGKLNTGMFGIPKEDYGFSNNARPGFRAPTFNEAAFRLDKSGSISIAIK